MIIKTRFVRKLLSMLPEEALVEIALDSDLEKNSQEYTSKLHLLAFVELKVSTRNKLPEKVRGRLKSLAVYDGYIPDPSKKQVDVKESVSTN